MTSELILTITILILTIYMLISQHINVKEREKLIKMYMAKDLDELTHNELIEKQKPVKVQSQPDLVEMDEVTDNEELFDKHIAAVKAQAKEDLSKEYDLGMPI